MQNLRLFLFATLGALLLLLWNAWQMQFAPAPAPQSTASAPAAGEGAAGRDEAPPAATGGSPGSATPQSPPGDEGSDQPGRTVTVLTDLLEVEIGTNGGGIRTVRLREHTVSAEDDTPFTLLSDQPPVFTAEAGVIAEEGSAPDHNATWQPERTEYRLAEGEDRIVVPLTWTAADGTRVTRRYVFKRDSYVVDLAHEITNAEDSDRRFYQYVQLRRAPVDSGQAFLGARSYTGGIVYTPEDKYQKYGFDDLVTGGLSRDVTDGWIAMIQHYFLAAVIPPRDMTQHFYSRDSGNQHILGMSSPWRSVAAGSSETLSTRLFIGPKDQSRLDQVVTGLQLTVDYGWFTILSKPLFIVLDWIHSVVGNWGWSIILLVLLIKLVFYKLSETSYRSMARMRKLQPKMQEIKERYGEDKQRMNQEVMELYKREKVNPLGGCLPILIQIPVFIALYWVLLESVELRQAPWILWINDLGQPDPFYILPLLMGATMFLQQKLNPAPMDPIQQKVMMALPVVFTVFFLFFPAGLVLYWVTNNSLSILQQWVITRRIEAGDDSDGDGSADKPVAKAKSKAKSKSKAKAKSGGGG